MGIVLVENILKHLEKARPGESALETVYRACSEVGGAVLTAVSTTVISFLPVFTMQGAEGKLFSPLAYTKTFALIGAIVVALAIIPPLAHWFIAGKIRSRLSGWGVWGALALAGVIAPLALSWFPVWLGLLFIGLMVGGVVFGYTWYNYEQEEQELKLKERRKALESKVAE